MLRKLLIVFAAGWVAVQLAGALLATAIGVAMIVLNGAGGIVGALVMFGVAAVLVWFAKPWQLFERDPHAGRAGP